MLKVYFIITQKITNIPMVTLQILVLGIMYFQKSLLNKDCKFEFL